MLEYSQVSPRLQRVYAEALATTPCTQSNPWDILIGLDEYVPGNKFKHENRRKVMCLSFNFKQLGNKTLSSASTWMMPIAVRSSKFAVIDGGWSALLRRFMRRLLLGPHGFANGVPIKVGSRVVMIFSKVSAVVADGDGHRISWEWKGAAALKPCCVCFNVWKKDSDLAHRSTSGDVEITCDDASKFKRWSQLEFEKSIDLLIEAKRRRDSGAWTQARYNKLAQVYGFSPTESGFLADAQLKSLVPTTAVVRYDWVHSMLQDGLLSVELWQRLKSAESRDPRVFQRLRAFLSSRWDFPSDTKLRGSHYDLAGCFSESMVEASRESDKLKIMASTLLLLYTLVRHFLMHELAADARDKPAELQSFNAACKVLDTMLLIKRRVLTCADGSRILTELLQKLMRLHIAAYGTGAIKPKHHWMMDVAWQLSKTDFLLDAFVVERINLRAKAAAEITDCTTSYERSVLAVAMRQQVESSSADNALGVGLVGRTLPHPSHSNVIVGKSVDLQGFALSVGDLVFLGDRCGQIKACLQVDLTTLVCLCAPLRCIAKVSPALSYE